MASLSNKKEFQDFLFGPAHPGSGNFSVRIKLDGERVVEAKADPGYLHRGFEKMMEYRNIWQNAVLSDRICVFEPLAWNLLFAQGIEKLAGIEVSERVKYVRVILAELSRLQSHLIWFGAFSSASGFETGFKIAFAYRDYILDILSAITGGRVYPAGYICPGGLMRDFPQGIEKEISNVLEKVQQGFSYFEKEDPLLRSRTKGIGVLKPEDAVALGATGQVLRASGISYDLRKSAPSEIYQKVDFNVPVLKEGDAYARLKLGLLEANESIKIIKQLLDKIPAGEYLNKEISPAKPFIIPDNEVYVRNETARGEGAMYIRGAGTENPYRVKIKGPSFNHLITLLEFLLKDAEIADVPIIYWSLNGCPADMDR
jgi:NADH-quinone oxidoreductase subunit D